MLSYPLSITLVFATKFSFLLMLLQNSTVSALNTNPDGSTLTKEQHLQLQQQKRRYNCEVSKHHIYIQARRSNSKQLKLLTSHVIHLWSEKKGLKLELVAMTEQFHQQLFLIFEQEPDSSLKENSWSTFCCYCWN